MQAIPCAAPAGSIEPAPLTSLPLGLDADTVQLTAFWSGDEGYFLRAERRESNAATCGSEEADGTVWYRIEHDVVAAAPDEETRAALGRLITSIIPMGGSRVAFPVGSTGRRVYRVWRSRGAEGHRGASRTRILGVRAGRSLRRPA